METLDDLSQSVLRGAALVLAKIPRRTQVHYRLLLERDACLNKDSDRSFVGCHFSQPEICSGDHCSASFCATRPAWHS